MTERTAQPLTQRATPWRVAALALLACLAASRAQPALAVAPAQRAAQSASGDAGFSHHCASCHGDYRAQGCAARTAPALMRPRPRPFGEALARRAVRRGVRRGGEGCSMPAFDERALPDAELTALVAWLRGMRSVR